MVCPPWLKKCWGGDMPPVPHQIAPMHCTNYWLALTTTKYRHMGFYPVIHPTTKVETVPPRQRYMLNSPSRRSPVQK